MKLTNKRILRKKNDILLLKLEIIKIHGSYNWKKIEKSRIFYFALKCRKIQHKKS